MNFEHLKLNIDTGENKVLPKQDNLTPANLSQWIRQSGLDDDTKTELIKMVKRSPSNTLQHFYKNIYKYIAKIHEKRNKA